MGDDGRLTRSQVAARWGCSLATVRRAEAQGKVHPEIGSDGVHRFDPVEIASASPARKARRRATQPVGDPLADGDLAAEIFAAFDQGVGPAEVVKDRRLPPAVVKALHGTWRELHGLAMEPTAAARLAQLEAAIGDLARGLDALRMPPSSVCDCGERHRRIEMWACPTCGKRADRWT